MGWCERVKGWLRRRPAAGVAPVQGTAPAYGRTARDEEDEEIAELIAIEII